MSNKLEFPTEITPELKHILGMPNFQCAPIAHLFRAAGNEIERKAEAEQAYVLHWLVKITLEHGADWMQVAEKKLEQVRASISKDTTDGR